MHFGISLGISDGGHGGISGYIVDWGDGTPPDVLTGEAQAVEHTYVHPADWTQIAVQAADVNGSITINTMPISVISRVAAPGSVEAAAVSSTVVMLSWFNNTMDTTGIEIEGSDDGVSFTLLQTVAPDVTSVIIDDLIDDTTYYFRVRAVQDGYVSPYSNVATVVLPLSAPSSLVVSADDASALHLSWIGSSNGEVQYVIEQSVDGGTFSMVDTVGASTTSYTVDYADDSATCSFRVIAVDGAGVMAASSVVTVTLQSTVTIPIINRGIDVVSASPTFPISVDVHGVPVATPSPIGQAESDYVLPESQIDMYSLRPTFTSIDISVPMPGGELALEFRRALGIDSRVRHTNVTPLLPSTLLFWFSRNWRNRIAALSAPRW